MSLPFQRAASIVRVTPAWSTVVVIVPEGAAAVAASARLAAAASALGGEAAVNARPTTTPTAAAAAATVTARPTTRWCRESGFASGRRAGTGVAGICVLSESKLSIQSSKPGWFRGLASRKAWRLGSLRMVFLLRGRTGGALVHFGVMAPPLSARRNRTGNGRIRGRHPRFEGGTKPPLCSMQANPHRHRRTAHDRADFSCREPFALGQEQEFAVAWSERREGLVHLPGEWFFLALL